VDVSTFGTSDAPGAGASPVAGGCSLFLGSLTAVKPASFASLLLRL
jgi:hypothetical protein